MKLLISSGNWSMFIGRSHPLLVHLPIGILLIAFVLTILSRREKWRHLQSALPTVLLFAALPLILGWYALAGLAIGPINSLLSTTFQERIPPTMRARTYGLLDASTMGAMPLGTFASGFVVTWLGLRTTLIAMSVLYLLATLSILVNPALKQMNRVAAEQV